MQQVFLSFTYSPHPDHVDETRALLQRVTAVIESMDLRVVTGEDLGGETLTDEIRQRIDKSDALVALVTPWRDRQGNKVAPPWVNDEFTYAKAKDKRAFRIMHPDYAGAGMYAAHEYTVYDKNNLADALVKLMKTLALWKRQSGRPMRIEIAPDVAGQRFDPARVSECEFQLFIDYEETGWRKAKIWPEPGALFAYLPGVPDDAKLRLRMKIDSETWQSDFQSPVGRMQLSRRQP